MEELAKQSPVMSKEALFYAVWALCPELEERLYSDWIEGRKAGRTVRQGVTGSWHWTLVEGKERQKGPKR